MVERVSTEKQPEIIRLFNNKGENHGVVVLHRQSPERSEGELIYVLPSDVHHHTKITERWTFLTPGVLYWDGEIGPVQAGETRKITPGVCQAVKPAHSWPLVIVVRVCTPDYSPDDDYEDPPGYDW